MFDEFAADIKKRLKDSSLEMLEIIAQKPSTSTAIAELTGLAKLFVSNALRDMHRKGLLFVVMGENAGYKYCLSDFGKLYMGQSPRLPKEDYEEGSRKIHRSAVIAPKELQAMLNKWSQERWTPKVVQMSPYLPLGLSKLYQYAYDQSVGSTIEHQELKEIQHFLSELRQSLEHTTSIVARIIGTPELWNTELFARFLLSTGISEIKANNLAIKMAEVNR